MGNSFSKSIPLIYKYRERIRENRFLGSAVVPLNARTGEKITLKDMVNAWQHEFFQFSCPECGERAAVVSFWGFPGSGGKHATAVCTHCGHKFEKNDLDWRKRAHIVSLMQKEKEHPVGLMSLEEVVEELRFYEQGNFPAKAVNSILFFHVGEIDCYLSSITRHHLQVNVNDPWKFSMDICRPEENLLTDYQQALEPILRKLHADGVDIEEHVNEIADLLLEYDQLKESTQQRISGREKFIELQKERKWLSAGGQLHRMQVESSLVEGQKQLQKAVEEFLPQRLTALLKAPADQLPLLLEAVLGIDIKNINN